MRSERGSASLVAVAIVALVMVLAMGAADLARVLTAAARAQSAADAAALAAAQELAIPSGREPSDVAGEYAALNGAVLVECACPAGALEALVEVRVDAGPMLLLSGERAVVAEARAVVETGG